MDDAAPIDPARRGALARELALVIAVGVVPMIVIGATLFAPSHDEPPPPFYQAGVPAGVRAALMGVTYALFILAPAVAILRSGQPLSHFGVRWRGASDVRWALGGFLVNYLSGWAIWYAYYATGFPLGHEDIRAYHYIHVSSFGEMVATWPWYVMVVLAEEQMARCYLITRFREVTGSKAAAVVCAALLFAGWHTFWGAAGVIHIIKAGLVFGFMFAATGGVGSVALAHFVYDGLALLPR